LAPKDGPAIEAAIIIGMGFTMDIDRERIAAARVCSEQLAHHGQRRRSRPFAS
jgi:hypothetical protein